MESRVVPLVIYLDGVRTVIGEATISGDGTFTAQINNDGLAGAIIDERYTTGDISLSVPGLYRDMYTTEQIYLGDSNMSLKELPPLCTCGFTIHCKKHPEDNNV